MDTSVRIGHCRGERQIIDHVSEQDVPLVAITQALPWLVFALKSRDEIEERSTHETEHKFGRKT
jgi:hypothetical protein